jgi:RNA polymerase subunit RPABC4/transcription elongation factor Spt4
MNCGSCNEMIPDDSMFCPECGARQDTSIASSFQQPMPQRDFEPVTGMNARMQQEANMGAFPNMQPEQYQNMAQNIQQNPNLPPNMYQQNQMGFPNQTMPMGAQNMPIGNQPMPNQTMPMGRPQNVVPVNNQMVNVPSTQVSDMPKGMRGPSIGSGAVPNANRTQFDPAHSGGTMIAHNPEVSQTDAMVNRLAEAERAVKDERRSQWLNMNQNAASDVLSSLGGDIPAHLKSKGASEVNAAQILSGSNTEDAPNDALLRRIAEVASRRVARKRGVAVESPQVKLVDDIMTVNLTYVDDGRVLDTPEDLTHAFEQAIQTEIALKGYDFSAEIQLFRNKDGKTEKIGEEESEEDMFACEMCDGLVKESDPVCPHCGAMFEEEEDDEPSSSSIPQRSGGPPGPSKGGPPRGPNRGGGPPGPSKGGPPGPKKGGSGGGPPGPSKGGPPKGGPGGGPPGPSKGGPPKGGPGGGPPGPSKGGPPKGGPGGGPPGPSKGGPPKGGPGGGPPGPSKGGPPKGGPGGGPPGPKKGGPGGGPPGPSKGGPPKGGPGGGPPGPKKGGPPKGGPGGGPPGPKKGGPPGPRK